MARTWIVVGDATTSGGRVITGSPATDIEGKPVARVGDKATCPTLHKGVFPIITGDASIVIDGQPVARQGDSLACGCRLLAGEQNLVYVDQGVSSASAVGPLPLVATSLLRATPALASKSFAQASAPQAEDLTLHYHYNDLDQTPVRGASYRVMLADDSIRSGNLDDAGKAVLGNVSVGPIQVLYQHDLDDNDDADILSAREQIKQALDAIVAQTRTDFAAEWTQWNGSGYFTRGALKLGNQGLGAVQGGWDYVSGTAEAVWQLAVLYYKTETELREWKMLLLTGDRAGLDRKVAEYRAQGKQVMAAASEMKEMFNLLIDDPAIVSMLPQFAEDWWAAIPPDEAENLKSRFGSQIAIDMLVSVVLAAVTIEAGGAGGIGYAAAKAGRMTARVGQKLFMLLEKLEDAFKALTKALRARKRRQADSNRQPNAKREVVTVVTPKRMPEKKLPCFSTQKLPADKYPEMDRQLQGQQQGLNDMTVQEYLDGRAAFDPNNRDQKVARAARKAYARDLTRKKTSHHVAQGTPPIEAERLAQAETSETMKALNALHNPDMVAGGRDEIADFGDGEVNTTIGRQWNQKKKGEVSRIEGLDHAANEVPHSERASSKMNGKMERCK
ncbi:MAG TPA: hypothetical protein DCY59_08645 [Micrococcaceae bacterium]|nr:hypothetical protein [Micrococcaceae bacterium]